MDGSTDARAPVSQPQRTARVDTTCSLAMKPEIRAVDMRQSPNPSGLNITETHLPIVASKLMEESSTGFSL